MILFESFFADSNNRINKNVKIFAPFLQLRIISHQKNIIMYSPADIVYLIK